MKQFKTTTFKKIGLLLIFFMLFFTQSYAQPDKKVILQGFWWDYWNDNHPNVWSNYLANLSERLADVGIDAVWIPPSYKNNSPGSVGYSPFDFYDLGDKYQKGHLVTRLGDKNQFLRMIAIMHANGLEVHQDVVLNHVDNAGSATGAGGEDPQAADLGGALWKNFRNVSYATPAIDESEGDYWSRSGRWSKNWQNFHPNPHHNTQEGDWASPFWGPDFCYGTIIGGGDNGYGESSNINAATHHNPPQYEGYNLEQAREWLKWFVRQTDVDGFRWDAVKHFAPFVMGTISNELANNNGDWSFGNNFVNTGEFFDNDDSLLDGFTNSANADAGSDLVGTFDFSLRHALLQMVQQGGTYDLSNLPASQQNMRSRTTTWVDNHDTFRPNIDVGGDYDSWQGDEHIHPEDGRKQAAYAVSFAMDGNHSIFFEDLFILNNVNRLTHQPDDPTTLAMRDYLVNIIWCYQNLDFEGGNYLVPHQAPDHLIIERENRAIIGITDNWFDQQNQWIQTSFPAGTILHDYSGSFGQRMVDDNGWVEISTPPCNGSNPSGRRGYSIWAPAGIVTNYSLTPRATTQEWEMADDLGDSHLSSLRQGGSLPASAAPRYIGSVYAQAGHPIAIDAYKEYSEIGTRISVWRNGAPVVSQLTIGNHNLVFVPSETGYYDIRIRKPHISNRENRYQISKVWVKVNYMAPTEILPVDLLHNELPLSFWEDEPEDEERYTIVSEVSASPNPFSDHCRINISLNEKAFVTLEIFDENGNTIKSITNDYYETGTHSFVYTSSKHLPKVYYRVVVKNEIYTGALLEK